MIDTVSITIQQNNFKIWDHKRFTPNTEGLFKPPYFMFGRQRYIKCTYNPTKTDLEKYRYLPRLTVIKSVRSGGFNINLKVEFSVPKLLHGNNFDEVDEQDFDEVCQTLKSMLLNMGVIINDVKIIADADVSTIHYSKNIILTDYTSPYMYLKEISKVNINRIYDFNQTDFRNEGHSIKYRSNDFEVTFYDKLKDLKQAKVSEKRAVENDNYIQTRLFDSIKIVHPFQVLRMEVRIGSRRKMKQLLNKYSINVNNQTFITLFSKDISRKILLTIIEELELKYPKILKSGIDNPEDLLISLQINNPNLSLKNLLSYVGVNMLINQIGVRQFRVLIDQFKPIYWYRLNNEMKNLQSIHLPSVFEPIKEVVTYFNKVELEKYKDKL